MATRTPLSRTLSTNPRRASVFILCVVASLAILALPASADPCSTTASCTHGSCSHTIQCSGVCACSSNCNSSGAFCRCHCFDIQIEPEFDTDKGDAPFARTASGAKMTLSASINLASLGVMVNDFMWGVSMDAADESHVVLSGTYTGSLTDILEDIGDDSGFSVSWDDTDKVVTLTVD